LAYNTNGLKLYKVNTINTISIVITIVSTRDTVMGPLIQSTGMHMVRTEAGSAEGSAEGSADPAAPAPEGSAEGSAESAIERFTVEEDAEGAVVGIQGKEDAHAESKIEKTGDGIIKGNKGKENGKENVENPKATCGKCVSIQVAHADDVLAFASIRTHKID
jgi:hypothetical protein